MIIMGDVHGKFPMLKNLSDKYKDEIVIQVGDLGVGFPGDRELKLRENTWWFRGNHDSPKVARAHPQYLGDYGYKEIEGEIVFWVAGAWSIDRVYRTEGVSWWADEELSIAELNKALDLYTEVKPTIMLTHDGPTQATQKILNKFNISKYMSDGYREESVTPTRTGQALSAMFEAHQPKLWVFGHWHDSWTTEIGKTTFRCVAELEAFDTRKV